MYAHLLSLIKETPLEVTQDVRNWFTNKLVATAKYVWVIETPFAVDLEFG